MPVHVDPWHGIRMVRGGCFIDKDSHGWLQVVFDGAAEKDMESGGERNAVGGGRAGMTRGTKR